MGEILTERFLFSNDNYFIFLSGYSIGKMNSKVIYLFLYNVTQCVGWAWILAEIVLHYFHNAKNSPDDLYNLKVSYLFAGSNILCKLSIKFTGIVLSHSTTCANIQTAALLEIVHAAFGLVRSAVVTTAVQIASRIFVVNAFYICVTVSKTCLR